MPAVNLNNEFTEYLFSPEELRASKIFTQVNLAMLQNTRLRYIRQKLDNLAPEDAQLDRSFNLKIAEIQGRIDCISELIDEHVAALKEAPLDNPTQGINLEIGLGDRAASRVHTS